MSKCIFNTTLIRNLAAVPASSKNVLTIAANTFFPLTSVDGFIIPAHFILETSSENLEKVTVTIFKLDYYVS